MIENIFGLLNKSQRNELSELQALQILVLGQN